jgi:H+/gluconate symporter-like permease
MRLMAMLPISTSVCTEPGRSTRKIPRPLAGLVAAGSAALPAPAFHPGSA